jgi:hypothetical protein
MVCLAATGEQCQEYKLPDKQYEDVVSCIRESHAEAAAWQLKNSTYTIIGTRCAKDAKVAAAPKS